LAHGFAVHRLWTIFVAIKGNCGLKLSDVRGKLGRRSNIGSISKVGGVAVVAKAQEILDAVAHAATVDPHAMAEGDWMTDIEALLTARNTLDALIAARLQAGDIREITVGECGRTMKGFLVEEQHLSRAEARRRVWLARQLPS
jgi:hypothetical protein